jgi:TolA-binding protein
MYCKARSSMMFLLLPFILTMSVVARAQSSANRPAAASVTILDSTKDQDGLLGSVRRVKTESAKLELKGGIVIEGARQLVEITTYALTGNRIENVSYPVSSTSAGKEEYKYDDKGHIIEMTLRAEGGAILSREAYDYEFDRFGNWTRMITSLVVFEDGNLKHEPVEITYRSLTYYFDDKIATAVGPAPRNKMPSIPTSSGSPVANPARLESGSNQLKENALSRSVSVPIENPPPAVRKLTQEEKPNSSATSEVLKDTGPAPVPLVERERSSPRTDIPTPEQKLDRAATNKNTAIEDPQPSAPAARNTSSANLSSVKGGGTTVPKNTTSETPSATMLALNHYKQGSDLFEVGDVNGAVAAYLQAIDLEPKSAEFRLALGHAYLKLQKDKEAAKVLKESVRLNPEVAEAQYGLGLANFRLDRFKDAADAFKKATLLHPEMAKAHYGLALAYQELGKQDALVEQYRILEKLDRNLARQLAQAFPDFNLPCRVPPFCK